MHNYYMCTVPGVVSDLTGQPKFTSIVLTWSAPQEPNGVIISYEVTYRVSDGNLTTTNTTNETSTIPSLTPGTNVTEISVSAYTSAGRGDPFQISQLTLEELPRELIDHPFFQQIEHYYHTILFFFIMFSPPMDTAVVMNVEAEISSATSVRVSWDRLDIPEITGYIVYYSQRQTDITEHIFSHENSVIIDNLLTDVEYQFEVVAVAELDGDVVTGDSERVTVLIPATTTTPTDSVSNVSDIVGGVVAFILAALVVVFVIVLRRYVW